VNVQGLYIVDSFGEWVSCIGKCRGVYRIRLSLLTWDLFTLIYDIFKHVK
jgi:hypothetical protein